MGLGAGDPARRRGRGKGPGWQGPEPAGAQHPGQPAVPVCTQVTCCSSLGHEAFVFFQLIPWVPKCPYSLGSPLLPKLHENPWDFLRGFTYNLQEVRGLESLICPQALVLLTLPFGGHCRVLHGLMDFCPLRQSRPRWFRAHSPQGPPQWAPKKQLFQLTFTQKVLKQ